jgi:hypothetical protein
MKKINLFLLSALAFFAGVGLQAQVTIGGVAYPIAGTILDMNSPGGVKGGLLLSNVAITNLDSIPEGTDYFPGVNTPELRDINQQLRGAMVYNTHPATVPGVYVWTGKRWIPIGETVQEEDQILFTITTTNNGGYDIPTSGYLNQSSHAYDWYVTVDGQPAVNAESTDGHFSGTSDTGSAGIQLTGLSAGKHKIRIIPHGDEVAGWGNAFGHYSGTGGANNFGNKQKLISIDAPLSTLAFAPESANATSAAYMFAYMFHNCSNLTTPAVIRDNYKLPTTITDLSNFLSGTHNGNTKLTDPIDLTLLKDWFSDNQTITDLSYFLYNTHNSNDSLKQPINLTPLEDWFSNNTKITTLSRFLANTHFGNKGLKQPINLTPLRDWFSSGRTTISLSNFLFNTHCNNTSLKLSGQIIFPNWVKTIKQGTTTPIQDVSSAFSQTFYLDPPEQGGDTGEPKFEDGTVLSSLRNPSSAKSTYTNRTGITSTSIGDNWK